ncbi:MAG TPA: YkgJ family cysteine cluster protein, partial [Spirochaetia bacterium]|nr:YkgJ family cysteine cluster protein [Spirochaetia bacterium]
NCTCRPGCGACCIALSITSLIPPRFPGECAQAKPAGVACRWLDEEYRCLLYGTSLRPSVCESLKPDREMCGTCREEALAYLMHLEAETCPD